jgi:anti-sigma regulatory factor (Ser/Thr protein kinase)
MQITGGADAPANARRSGLSSLRCQLSDSRAFDVAVVVTELVTNSVVHAKVGPEQTLTVELLTLEDRLRITVIDPGSTLEPRLQRRADRTSGGLGLLLVEKLSTAWGVARDGIGSTRVWCEFLLVEAR